MKPTLKVKVDNRKEFNRIIKRFEKDEILVGIPESKTERSETESGEPITNAAILAINHFGSEVNNIPPRPVLAIGIRNAQKEIAEQLSLAVKNGLRHGISATDTYYNRAGIIASNSCKKVINEQDGILPAAESTLKARKRPGFGGRKNGFQGDKSLLVTGQMRNAITYVLKGGK